MAINNLAEQCYISTYGPLENMNMLTKMDMVKVQRKYLCWYFFKSMPLTDVSQADILAIWFQEYILDKTETEKRARTQLESGSALTSGTALTDRREKGSMKGSTTQLKSPSKVSRKSQMTSWEWGSRFILLPDQLCCVFLMGCIAYQNDMQWRQCLSWWYAYNFNQRFAIHSAIPLVVAFCFNLEKINKMK